MILFSLFLLIGICLEGVASFFMIQQNGFILIILGLHFIASLSITNSIYQICKNRLKDTQSIIFMLFTLILFVPILGIIGSLVIARWLTSAQKRRKFQSIQTISLTDTLRPLRNEYGISGLTFSLQSQSLSLPHRIKALKILSTLPASKSNNLIRTVLPDKQDELRLLAFNLIDKQEKRIIKDINKILKLEKKAHSDEKKAIAYKYLAFEYWELVYCNLVEPAMLNFFLSQTIYYIKNSMKHLSNDAPLWYLLGRVYMRQRKTDLAVDAFERSINLGQPINVVIPYLAEGYFYQHKYREITNLLSSHNSLITSLLNKSIIDFWSYKHE